MNSKDYNAIVFSDMKDKKNILFIFSILFLLIVMFSSLTFIYFVFDYKKQNIDKNLLLRTLYVYNESNSYENIKNIKNVEFSISDKYLQGTSVSAKEFDEEDKKGVLEIYPLLNKNDISILKGKNISDNYEAICPQKFYPHNYENKDSNGNILSRMFNYKYLKGSNLIEKSFTIKNNKQEDVIFHIVGIYNAAATFNSMNTCFVSLEAYDEIASDYTGYTISKDIDGKEHKEYLEYDGNIVRVNNYKNIEEVTKTLENQGYFVSKTFEFEERTLNFILYFPLIICILSILLSILLIYNFINKKIKYHLKKYGMLKAIGFTNMTIKNVSFIENMYLFTISYVIAFFLYFMLFKIISLSFFSEFLFNGFIIKVPYLYLIVVFFGLCIIICLMNHYLMNHHLKLNAANLLKDSK